MNVQRNFVTFYSPGTFMAETTERPIDTWDVDEAVKIARTITERHGAKPYAFTFSTRSRGDVDLDSKVSATSGYYFLGGTIETLAEVEARNDPKEEVLRDNMRGNNIDRVVVNNNSWRWTQPLTDRDAVLDVTL